MADARRQVPELQSTDLRAIPCGRILNALLWVLVYWQVGVSPILPVYLAFVSAMVALIFIDAEHMILPNVITYPLLVLSRFCPDNFPDRFPEKLLQRQTFAPGRLSRRPTWRSIVFLVPSSERLLVGTYGSSARSGRNCAVSMRWDSGT